jgi:8-hydroxy-5-deazaflavin:NADPH oxidoreductase
VRTVPRYAALMDVAIIGGTGAEGFGLALRLARAGHHVTIGSRSADKAAEAKANAHERLGADVRVDGVVNEEAAASGGVVIVTVPFAGQAETYKAIASHLADGTVVMDATSPLMAAVGGKAWEALRPWQGSAAELARTILPAQVQLVASFHTVAAETLQALEHPVDSDALVCGDEPQAKATVGSLIDDIPGMRWVDCGPLANARIAETLTPLLISVNRRYKTHDAGFRISGRETWGDPAR